MLTFFILEHEHGEHGPRSEDAENAAPRFGGCQAWRMRSLPVVRARVRARVRAKVREMAALFLGHRGAVVAIQRHVDGGLEPPAISKRFE